MSVRFKVIKGGAYEKAVGVYINGVHVGELQYVDRTDNGGWFPSQGLELNLETIAGKSWSGSGFARRAVKDAAVDKRNRPLRVWKISIKPEPNPIYPRWVDPFFFTTREDLERAGDGDAQLGYDRILDGFIESWNADAAVNKYVPPTSRERGMEWEVDIKKVTKEWRRIRAQQRAANEAAQEAEASGR